MTKPSETRETRFFFDRTQYTQGDEMTGTAVVACHPQYSLGIRLTKKANL
jgi:hypothetical protein